MLTDANQVGKREQLADYVTRVDAKTKPCLAMMPKGKALTNMLMQFQVDDFEDAEDISVETATDVESYDNASPNREVLKTYAMKVRDSAMVDDVAEEVNEVAGVRSELANSIMKKLEKVGRCIEAFICGDQEHVAGGAGTKYRGRGLGLWIGPGSGQTTFPVPTSYETPTASLDNTAMASFTEEIVNGLLESSYGKTGTKQTFQGLVGTTLKRRFSKFSSAASGVTNTGFATVRMFQSQFNHTIDNVVDVYEGDFGTIVLHPTLWNAHPNFGGSAAAQARRGYFLLMHLLELNYKRKPRVKQLEGRGGGPRFLVDAIVGWKVKNPLALIKTYATT